MIGYPGAESKPDFACGAQVPPTGALLDRQGKSIKLPIFATNNLLPDLLCVPLLSVPVGAGPRALSRQKAPKCQSGRMT